MTTSQGHQLYYAEGPQVQAVIVKSYTGYSDAQKAFMDDLRRWREQMYTIHILLCSWLSDEPTIILTDRRI